ncbi:Fe2+-dependent dioxygenase [Novosphingobium sp.]|uniref:Fe2+-dependent dioxygenase n=1 Tax=Novosphingobium sp. TaxID=1874826 RepID=UPI0025D92153|nr:Fe2+-dependent dioxygenase [Novosphingobium sp.]
MVIRIEQVLSREAALALGRRIAAAEWIDGNATSGPGAAMAKRNRQLPEAGEAAQAARAEVQRALAQSDAFLSAALPHAIYPPLFNRYGPGDRFDIHVDNAVRVEPATGTQMRADMSATLFLSDDYDGGVLTIETPGGEQAVKYAAGDMVLYPSTTLHRVTEVTRGERIAAFFWVQSLVRDSTMRETLWDLDRATQALAAERGKTDSQVLRLAKVYHNLVRASAL